MWVAAFSTSGSKPLPIAYKMSRSVMMPTPEPSGSCTTAEPTRRVDMSCAVCRIVCSGPTFRITVLIASRTCIAHHPFGTPRYGHPGCSRPESSRLAINWVLVSESAHSFASFRGGSAPIHQVRPACGVWPLAWFHDRSGVGRGGGPTAPPAHRPPTQDAAARRRRDHDPRQRGGEPLGGG